MSLLSPRTQGKRVAAGDRAAAGNALQFHEWKATLAKHFFPLNIEKPEPSAEEEGGEQGFYATLSAHPIGPVEVFHISSEANTVERSPRFISENAAAEVKVYLQLTGRSTIFQDQRTCILDPGELTSFVTHRPYEVRLSHHQRGFLFKLPAETLTLTVHRLQELALVKLSPTSPFGAAVIPGLEAMANNPQAFDEEFGAPIALNLIESAFVAFAQAQRATGCEHRDELFARAIDFIDAHLADAALGPQEIAAALYVSVRSLQSHFADQELTVTSYIRTRRLHALGRALLHPDNAKTPIALLASRCGLYDASYTSRAFRAEFGLSPRDFRARA